MATLRVVVIDDHPFFRDGIVRALSQSDGVQVVGEAGNGVEGLELIRTLTPDVAVVDQQMPRLDGVGLTRAVHSEGLATRVLLLSAVTDSAVVFAALQDGANGYLSKDTDRLDVIDAVRRIARGETVLPPELAAGLVGEMRTRRASTETMLTEREQQVLEGMARGLSAPQLAAEMILATSTIKTHIQHVYEKLQVSDRGAAVAEGMRRGLLRL